MKFIIIISSASIALAAILLLWRKNNTCAPANKQIQEKEKRKQEILKILEQKEKLSNKEIRKQLKISDRTVVKYMDELEKEGKVKQVGKTGKSAYYAMK